MTYIVSHLFSSIGSPSWSPWSVLIEVGISDATHGVSQQQVSCAGDTTVVTTYETSGFQELHVTRNEDMYQ